MNNYQSPATFKQKAWELTSDKEQRTPLIMYNWLQSTPFLFLSTRSAKIQNTEKHPNLPFLFLAQRESIVNFFWELHVWLLPLKTYLDKQWGHSLWGIIIPWHTVNHSDGINQILYSMCHGNLNVKYIKSIPSYVYRFNNQYPMIFKTLNMHKIVKK